MTTPRSRASARSSPRRRRRRRRRSRWARPSRPTPCSSARASRWCWRSPRGFGDALRIGYQARPDIFARRDRPARAALRPVSSRSTSGSTRRRRGAAPARRARRRAPGCRRPSTEGYRALAIVLMHGWRWTAHEAALAAIAREIGFTQVSASHEVEPLIKLIGRGDTAVVDAYLSPVLRRYVDKVVAGLSGARTGRGSSSCSRTAGSPTPPPSAARTRSSPARRAASSAWRGPRGAGRLRPCHRLRHGRHLDRRLAFRRRLRADQRARGRGRAGARADAARSTPSRPAAARSAAYDGSRFRVGPDSAGAVPGPACYRARRAADRHRLQRRARQDPARAFPPASSGPAATSRSTPAASLARCAEIGARAGMAPREVAEGFVRIAVDNMANAIKQISIARGHDVTRYTLQCFGGAGGQHACLVADALGIGAGDDPPARRRAQRLWHGPRRHGRAAPADAGRRAIWARCWPSSKREASAALRGAGRRGAARSAAARRCATKAATPRWRSTGSDDMRAGVRGRRTAPASASCAETPVVVETAIVEAVGKGEARSSPVRGGGPPRSAVEGLARTPAAPPPVAFGAVPLPVPGRISMTAPPLPRRRIPGPALIVDPSATTIVEPGWQAEVDALGNLILTRAVPATRAPAWAPRSIRSCSR